MNDTKDTSLTGIRLNVLLGDFLGMARRLWWLGVVLALVFGAGMAVRARMQYYPQYQASASFTIYVTDPLQAEIRGYNTATAEQMAKTFPYILTSSALKDRVMQELSLKSLPVIRAQASQNTNIFTLTVTASDPDTAQDVLEAVMIHYPDVAEFVVGPTVMNLLDESGRPEEPCNRPGYGAVIRKGAVLGVLLWAVVVLLLAMSRTAVHDEEELKQLLNVRCMGTLPRVSRRKRRDTQTCPMVGGGVEDTGFSESVFLLRSRVEKSMQAHDRKVLLIGSATPGEGKTTVSVNLAKALALKGYSTLLVDCDLRSPSVADNLGLRGIQNGLADHLAGNCQARDIFYRTATPNLWVTPAGGEGENGSKREAAEQLARPECREFLRGCREVFDYIILDTPPVSLLADASELAGDADAALFVIRQNYAPRGRILEGVRMLTDSGLPLCGCALNYVSGHISGYGYGYGGYGHYGKYGRYGRYGQDESLNTDIPADRPSETKNT